MKRMKKLAMVILSVTMIMAIFTGCAKSSADNPEKKVEANNEKDDKGQDLPDEQDPVTLRFSWWGGDERNEATIKVIEKFEDKYPWITIEPEFSGGDGYQQKLSTSLASGTAPDIIQNGTGWMPDFNSKGDFFINFNDYLDTIDITGFSKEYLDNVGTFDEKLLGLPSGIAGPAFLINQTLVDEIGLNIPENLTWDDLITLGKQVQEYDSNLYLINMDTSYLKTHILRPYILQLTGTPFINDELKEMSFTQEELIQVMSFMKDLYDNNVFQPAKESIAFKDSVHTNPKWIAGDFVGALTNSSTLDILTRANEEAEYVVIPMPLLEGAKDDGFYANPPQLMCVYNESKHIKEALMFLDYFYNDAESAEILKDLRSVPPTAKAREICEEKGLISPLVKESVDLALSQNGTNEMGLSTNAEVEAIMEDMIESVIYGNTTPDEAAANAVKMLDILLSEK